jgi:outer membrane protein OmpU
MGAVDGAEARLKVDSRSVARGTGGVAGDYFRYLGATYRAFPQYILTPDLVSANQSNDSYLEREASRISYYSPKVAGLQLGVSYAPESSLTGQNIFGTSTVATQSDLVSGGLTFEQTLDSNSGLAVSGSLTGESGNGVAGNPDRKAWAAGLATAVKGVKLAGSYGDLGETALVGADSKYYDVTLGTEVAGYGASVGYFKSKTQGAATGEVENISVGADKKIAAGLTAYADYSIVKLNDGTTEEKGYVGVAGLRINF